MSIKLLAFIVLMRTLQAKIHTRSDIDFILCVILSWRLIRRFNLWTELKESNVRLFHCVNEIMSTDSMMHSNVSVQKQNCHYHKYHNYHKSMTASLKHYFRFFFCWTAAEVLTWKSGNNRNWDRKKQFLTAAGNVSFHVRPEVCCNLYFVAVSGQGHVSFVLY